MSFNFVYMTAASEDEAHRIARTLVEDRLAACTNVIPGMTSYYWWEGQIDQGKEVVVVAKTQQRLVEKLVDRVKALHSYSCPCIVALPIEQGNPAFLEWIEKETA